jgi:hypothetical protein
MQFAMNACIQGLCDSNLEQTLYDWMPGYKFGTWVGNRVFGRDMGSWGEMLEGTADLFSGGRASAGLKASQRATGTLSIVDDARDVARGRGRSQQRLRELANDPKLGSAERGWIRQEINSIERGTRESIRRPPGKQLAHARGREAAKGYDHVDSPSQLQDRQLHRLQHKYDDFGRKNTERP